MPRKFFHTTEKQPLDISVGSLALYLERYVAFQFPDNNIEHWWKSANPSELNSQIPELEGDDGFSYVACYACSLGGEDIITVSLMLKDGFQHIITKAKCVEHSEQSWSITQAITEVLETLYLRGEIPVILELADRLSPWAPEDREGKSIYLYRNASDTTLDVVFDDKKIASYDFRRFNEDYAKESILDRLSDWCRVAENLRIHVAIRVVKEEEGDTMTPSLT
jgi:hypothetical protein